MVSLSQVVGYVSQKANIPIGYLSEELTVQRYKHGNNDLEKRAIEIMGSRALSRVRGHPNKKNVVDALNYASSENVAAAARERLEGRKLYWQASVKLYQERIKELQESENGAKGRGKSDIDILGARKEKEEKYAGSIEKLLEKLNPDNVAECAKEYEKLRRVEPHLGLSL